MELTIENLSFCVGLLGSIRPSDPTKLDPSASKIKTTTMSGSLVDSSSEVNSSSASQQQKIQEKKIKELDETREELYIGGTVDKSYISQRDFAT
jgi:hypothetical protein